MAAASREKVLSGRHVLFALLAFFGAVFAVNGYFLYSALSTHTGVVANEPYRRGLKYNERIEADERQARLGWREAVSYDAAASTLKLSLDDRAGSPVGRMTVSAKVGRAASAREDVTVKLEEVAGGRYQAQIPARGPGEHQVDIEVSDPRQSGEIVYRARTRLWLKP